MLCTAPNGRPITRRRGTSGKVRSRPPLARRLAASATGRTSPSRAAVRLAGAVPSSRQRSRNSARAPRPPGLRERVARKLGVKTIAVHEHGEEELLDVLGDDVVTSVQECPRAGGALEREAPANRAPMTTDSLSRVARTRSTIQRCESLVDVDVLDRALELLHVRRGDDRLERSSGWPCSAARDDVRARPPAPGSRARYAGRSGRAAPRGAGTCPRARSGSPSR